MTASPAAPTVFALWRRRLAAVLAYYEAKRAAITAFWPKLLALFVLLNLACYWLAIATAFSERLAGDNVMRYVLIEVPVGLLGAVFDVFSLGVTVVIVRRALRTLSELSYLAHLSIDMVIAVLATCWVLIVFSVSGWVVDRLAPELAEPPAVVLASPPPPSPPPRSTPAPTPVAAPRPAATAAPAAKPVAESLLAARSRVYRQRLIDAITNPFAPENLRNIYFGLLMGASAMLPTGLHILLSLAAIVSASRRRRTPAA